MGRELALGADCSVHAGMYQARVEAISVRISGAYLGTIVADLATETPYEHLICEYELRLSHSPYTTKPVLCIQGRCCIVDESGQASSEYCSQNDCKSWCKALVVLYPDEEPSNEVRCETR